MLAGNTTIRQADINDAAVITALSITTFCDTFAKDNRPEDMAEYVAKEMSMERLATELADSSNLFYLASCNGVPVGYCKMRTAALPDAPANCIPIEIERIYVLKEYHGTGAGAALMRHCVDYATAHGYDTIWLGVWEHNHRAIRFYEQWGFVLFGTHGFRLGSDDQTDVLMKKSLSGAAV